MEAIGLDGQHNERSKGMLIITTVTDSMTISGVGTATSVCRLQHHSLQLKKLNRFSTKKMNIETSLIFCSLLSFDYCLMLCSLITAIDLYLKY